MKRKPIALLFRAWHLYTVRHPDGTRDTSTEKRLSAIETKAGPIVSRLIQVARIGVPRRSFVLGSSPFARFMSRSQRRQDLGDPEAELWLPIAPDVALASYGLAGTAGFIEITHDEHIRQVNWLIARASTAFASPSRELVEALARWVGSRK